MTEIEELRRRVEWLEAFRVATLVTFASLIAKHHRHTELQLHLTSLLEQQLGGGSLGKTLNPQQREWVREFVEHLGVIGPKTAQDQTTAQSAEDSAAPD